MIDPEIERLGIRAIAATDVGELVAARHIGSFRASRTATVHVVAALVSYGPGRETQERVLLVLRLGDHVAGRIAFPIGRLAELGALLERARVELAEARAKL